MAATISPETALHTFETGIADDGKLFVFIDRKGLYGDKMTRREFKHTKRVLKQIEKVTGVDIVTGTGRKFSRRSELDIIQADPDGQDGGAIGVWSPQEWGAIIAYENFSGGVRSDDYIELSTITHEIGHAFGLDHPPGGGFDPNYTTADTIMSYNDTGEIGFSRSDIQTLRDIW